MLPNELLAVRFYGQEGEPTRVESRIAAEIFEQMRALVGAVSSAVWPRGQAEVGPTPLMHYVAPPRAGCIEFLFQPEVSIPPGFERGLAGAIGIAADTATVAAILWAVAFGERGLLARFQRTEPRGNVGEPEAQMVITLTGFASKNRLVVDSIPRLVSTASKAGFRQIEIQFRDEAPIPMLLGSRQRPGLIARRGSARPGADLIDRTQLGKLARLKRMGEAEIPVRYKGEEYPAFMGILDDDPTGVVVIWAPTHIKPADGGSCEVRGEVVPDPDQEITPLAEVPDSFEDAVAALFIRRVAEWKA